MPATFFGRCLVRLLLLLLCTSLSGGNPADAATQEFKPGNKLSVDLSEHVIVLPAGPFEKNISVASPTEVDLTCKLDENSNLKNPQVTWKKGSETISHTSKAPNSWTIKVTISESSHLGSYTCFLKAEKELSATFHLHVPPIDGREKPVIAYIGDTGVMVCKTEHHPRAWKWFMNNGTELVSIDKILPKDKYEILSRSASESRLEIHRLTVADSGEYWCEADFVLGPGKARFEVRVLSVAEPLKPFIAVVAEVAILVTLIGLYEVYSKKRKAKEGEKEFDQIEQLKSGDNVTEKDK
ncbi:embigin isoform X2 [Zonotrichia albicollis]|uniref:embigin isoform X2 n=1 Tax=Zonotrichia albicollis TaxID=44394 RepID=UPI003D80B146